MTPNRGLTLLFLLSSAAYGQLFSIGIKGGVPFTGGFSDVTAMGVDTISRTFSNSNEYIIGTMGELHLPLGLSVEADALYRPLNLATSNTVVPQTVPFQTSRNINSFEFPILAKYHFPFPLVKPYVEAGPSFRAVSISYLSNSGFTMGGGVELKISKVRFGPEIRYTRWGSDGTPSVAVLQAPSNVNQAEFLLGLSF